MGFSRLVKKTECNEHSVIEMFDELLISKSRKNEEFKSLIDTLRRDRELTKDIRKRNYLDEEIDGSVFSARDSAPISLQAMRLRSEEDRKQKYLGNANIIEWYTASINKLALLASNGEDMSVCHSLMNLIRNLLERG